MTWEPLTREQRKYRLLTYAALLYALGTAVHTIDHLRRGPDSVTAEVKELGALFTLAAVLVLALVFRRHRLAPLFAVIVGFSHGLGIIAVHWFPDWSAASDSLLTARAPLFSWVAVALEVAGALAVGIVGFSILVERSNGRHLAWLLGLLAVVLLVPLGTAAVAGGDWEVARVVLGFVVVFGVLAIASRLAPCEWVSRERATA